MSPGSDRSIKPCLVASRDGACDSRLLCARGPWSRPLCPPPRRPPYPAFPQPGKFAIERGDGLVGAYSCARVCGGVACEGGPRIPRERWFACTRVCAYVNSWPFRGRAPVRCSRRRSLLLGCVVRRSPRARVFLRVRAEHGRRSGGVHHDIRRGRGRRGARPRAMGGTHVARVPLLGPRRRPYRVHAHRCRRRVDGVRARGRQRVGGRVRRARGAGQNCERVVDGRKRDGGVRDVHWRRVGQWRMRAWQNP